MSFDQPCTLGATMIAAGIDRPRMVTRRIASRSTARLSALRTRMSLNGFLPLTFEYFSSSLNWSMPMKMVRFSAPSSTLSFGSFCRRVDVLHRQVGDQVDVAGEQRRDARRVGLDRRVDHVA